MSHQYINSKKHLRIDSNNDGVVDDSDKLGNKPADEYMTTDTNQDISGVKTFESIKLNLTSGEVCEEGRISWNPDEGTAVIGMPRGDVCLNVGQEMFLPRPTNKSGDEIANGTPVYISGAAGTNAWIDVADASVPDNNRKTLAIATETIANNQKGYCTTFGLVRDIDTDGIAEGNEVFVAVGGGITGIKPDLPNGIVRVGHCLREHHEEGVILVSIDTKSVKDILTDSGDLTIRTSEGYTWVIDQPTWRDINLGSALLSRPAASQPDIDEFKDNTGTDTGIETYAFAVGEKVNGSFEIQHDYEEGSDLSPHIHFQGITAPTGTDKVQWQIIYTISRNGNTLSPTTTITGEADVDTQYAFYIASFTDIDGTNIKIGDQFLFQLARIAASVPADEYAGDALISTVGVHYQQDTNGSRQKFVK